MPSVEHQRRDSGAGGSSDQSVLGQDSGEEQREQPLGLQDMLGGGNDFLRSLLGGGGGGGEEELTEQSEEELQAELSELDTQLDEAMKSGAGDEQLAPLQARRQEVLAALKQLALDAGRTHSDENTGAMLDHYEANANSASPTDCITTVNAGMRKLLDQDGKRLGSRMDLTMGKLEDSGDATSGEVIEFVDSKGNITKGIREPAELSESVWDKLLEMAGGDVGNSVFGLSIMDGYHSVTLTLDNNDPSKPVVYWSHQWGGEGKVPMDKASLDERIARHTLSWWGNQPPERKPRTRATLWRVTNGKASKPPAGGQ